MTRAFWQKNCYYSNYGRLVGRYWRYFWLVIFVSSCMTCLPLLWVQRRTSESDIGRSSSRSWHKNFDTRLQFSSANKIFQDIVKDEFHPIRQKYSAILQERPTPHLLRPWAQCTATRPLSTSTLGVRGSYIRIKHQCRFATTLTSNTSNIVFPNPSGNLSIFPFHVFRNTSLKNWCTISSLG